MSIKAKYTECIYNENGREIRHTTSDGVINFDVEKPVYTQSVNLEEKVYNDNGDMLEYNHKDGYREKWTYDHKNRLLSYKNSHGKEEQFIYDNDFEGLRLPVLKDNGHGYIQKWKYDDRFTETHKMISYENSHGEWNKTTYDKYGRKLTYADSKDYFEKYTYNENGCMLTYKNGKGYWEENTYNDLCEKISHKDSTGLYEKFIYTPTGVKLLLLHQTNDYFEEWQYNLKFQVIKHTNTLYDFCEEFIYDNYGNRHTTYYASKENIKSPEKWTYASDGNILTYKNAHEYNEYTYNEADKTISHKLYEF